MTAVRGGGRRALPAVCALALGLAGCGPGAAALDATGLGLQQRQSPAARASTTVYTSPDGGIYKNPDHLEVVLVARQDVDAVEASLGGAASAWAGLHAFGRFTVVALRLRDDGKVSSDPQLGALQLASDYAPAGTGSGPLHHFYHPTYPLAVVASVQPGEDCSVHLDPAGTVIALLVYPPIDLGGQVVWGSYGDFALTVPAGGAVPPLPGALHAVACRAPMAAPSPS